LTIRVFDLQAGTRGDIFTHSYRYLDTETAENVVELAIDAVSHLCGEYDNIAAIGVAVPGPFRKSDGSVYIGNRERTVCGHFPFLERFRARIDLPIVIDHDANTGALGYWRFRTQCDMGMALLYLLASEGIGGGIVSEGQIFTGQIGHTSEIGHIIVEQGGLKCVCGGHGCLDAYASALAVEQRARGLLTERSEESSLSAVSSPTIAQVFAAMSEGDRFALRLIRDAGRHMGLGFASLIPIFDPDLVVIGDLMAGGGDVLLEGIHAALDRTLSPFYKKPDFVLADPDDDLVLLGAATIAIERVLANPTELLMNNDG
jgi:predicted NBD/HSP70 family sugar kinase